MTDNKQTSVQPRDGLVDAIAETYHDQRYGFGLWDGATFQRKRHFRQCAIEILTSIETAGFSVERSQDK